MANRTNLVTNPSFETNTTGWTGSEATLSRVTSPAGVVGTTCLAATATSSVPVVSINVPATAGTTYSASGRMRASVSGKQGRIYLVWKNSSGGSISTSLGSAASVPTTFWLTTSMSATAPTGTASVNIQMNMFTASAGDVLYVDGFLFEEAASPGTYFDGDTTDTADWAYSWTGTAHNSTSLAEELFSGSATGGYSFAGSAVGEAPPDPLSGSVTGAFDFSGAATGESPNLGSVSGGFAFSGSSVGERSPTGSSTGSFAFTGSATGEKVTEGTSTGSFTFTGTAVGETPPNVGSITGSFDFTGSSAGSRASDGAVTGAYDFAGTSTGEHATWAPKNLQAVAVSGSQIDLTWDALGYATAYDIERDGVVIATDVATNSYSDTGLTGSTEYTYRVRGVYA